MLPLLNVEAIYINWFFRFCEIYSNKGNFEKWVCIIFSRSKRGRPHLTISDQSEKVGKGRNGRIGRKRSEKVGNPASEKVGKVGKGRKRSAPGAGGAYLKRVSDI